MVVVGVGVAGAVAVGVAVVVGVVVVVGVGVAGAVGVGVGVGVAVVVGVVGAVGVGVAMIDALLLLLDRNAHPGTLEDTALAAGQLKGVTHVHRMERGTLLDVDAYRERLEAALRQMDEARAKQRMVDTIPLAERTVPYHLVAEVDDDGA